MLLGLEENFQTTIGQKASLRRLVCSTEGTRGVARDLVAHGLSQRLMNPENVKKNSGSEQYTPWAVIKIPRESTFCDGYGLARYSTSLQRQTRSAEEGV